MPATGNADQTLYEKEQVMTEKQEGFLDDDEGQETSTEPKVKQEQDANKDLWLLKTACLVLSSDLTNEVKKLDSLGQGKAAAPVRANVGELEERIPRILDDQGIEGLNEKQRELLRVALPIFKKNTKAAKGTNYGIGRGDWASECQLIVEYIEDVLAPQLEEQTEMAGAR